MVKYGIIHRLVVAFFEVTCEEEEVVAEAVDVGETGGMLKLGG